jgi:P2-related tail formation protein
MTEVHPAGDADDLLRDAAETNARRDSIERAAGFAAHEDLPPMMQLRTVVMALDAGLRIHDWTCVAEAADMLGSLIRYKPWLVNKETV